MFSVLYSTSVTVPNTCDTEECEPGFTCQTVSHLETMIGPIIPWSGIQWPLWTPASSVSHRIPLHYLMSPCLWPGDLNHQKVQLKIGNCKHILSSTKADYDRAFLMCPNNPAELLVALMQSVNDWTDLLEDQGKTKKDNLGLMSQKNFMTTVFTAVLRIITFLTLWDIIGLVLSGGSL